MSCDISDWQSQPTKGVAKANQPIALAHFSKKLAFYLDCFALKTKLAFWLSSQRVAHSLTNLGCKQPQANKLNQRVGLATKHYRLMAVTRPAVSKPFGHFVTQAAHSLNQQPTNSLTSQMVLQTGCSARPASRGILVVFITNSFGLQPHSLFIANYHVLYLLRLIDINLGSAMPHTGIVSQLRCSTSR